MVQFVSLRLHLQLIPYCIKPIRKPLFSYSLPVLSHHLSFSPVNMSLPPLCSPAAHFLSAHLCFFHLPVPFLSLNLFSLHFPISQTLHLSLKSSWERGLKDPLSLQTFCCPEGNAAEIHPPSTHTHISLYLSVMEADQETILSRHPSPLVGQRSDQHDPSPQPVSRFNACYFSRWIKERQAERWADAGVRENKKGWMTQTWCKEMIPPPLPIML